MRLADRPSKFPPGFGIGLHIDDAEGVADEGHRFNFRVLQISPSDRGWAERVFAAL